MKVFNQNGVKIEFDMALIFMDDEIREDIHARLSPCSEQKFFSAYEKEHRKKYGEDFIASQISPAW